eukprot:766599-Hanusia_phi.AAC.2
MQPSLSLNPQTIATTLLALSLLTQRPQLVVCSSITRVKHAQRNQNDELEDTAMQRKGAQQQHYYPIILNLFAASAR